MKHKRFLTIFAVLALFFSILPQTVEAKKPKVKSVYWTNSEKTRTEYVGTTITLKAKIKPDQASQKVSYSSSNKKIATVTSKGKVKFKKAGKVKITAKAKSNKKKKCTVTIKVVKKPVYNVEYVAHRGFSNEAPENTMAAFKLASLAKPWGMETDIKITKDGRFVMIHDDNLLRTHNVNQRVDQITYEDLRKLPIVNGANVDKYAPQRVPSLKEFLEFCKTSSIVPVLELKFDTTFFTSMISFMDGETEVMALYGDRNKAISSEVTIPAYSKEGYALSWNTKKDGTGETITEIPEIFPEKNVTYYAVWSEDAEQTGTEYEPVMIDERTDYYKMLMDEIHEVMGEREVVLHSFTQEALGNAEKANKGRGHIVYEFIYNDVNVKEQIDLCASRKWHLAVHYSRWTKELVRYAKKMGVHTDAWTVYTNDKAYRMLTYGIDSITTDRKLW